MSSPNRKITSLTLFCKVVDNFGDIGICWRLARQFQAEHQIKVTLWVDDLVSFQRICPLVNTQVATQDINKITVIYWQNQGTQFTVNDVDDIIIEFFGCDIPPHLIETMAQCEPKPVWINLEGLTAEEWVEGCHRLPSSHPRFPLTKYFFFPGFNGRTGGLMREAGLHNERENFQNNPDAQRQLLGSLGLSDDEIKAFKVSLFCYPQAPVSELFNYLQASQEPVVCLVPEGVADAAVNRFFGEKARAGSGKSIANLTVKVLPFIPQTDYDKLLWTCDFNFVRGEDSFVRAQWANKPFIWHIYPQDENLHHKKLRAFLQHYAPASEHLRDFFFYWNAVGDKHMDGHTLWRRLSQDLAEITEKTQDWQMQVTQTGDLSANLLSFSRSVP